MSDSDGASGRPRRLRLLVTGFGAFPGMPRNPSATVVTGLARRRAAFRRRGVDLTTQILPVLYDVAAAFAPIPTPDAIIHIGVAGRRKQVSLETRAHHRRAARHPDASGRAPQHLRSGTLPQHRVDAEWRTKALAVALRRIGVPAASSQDAGAYVCNALLYRSLDAKLAPAIFIHVPSSRVCPPERIAEALSRTLPDVVTRLVRQSRRVRL